MPSHSKLGIKEQFKMKCNFCDREVVANCDWNQGRCPHRAPMLTDYHFRYFNLLQTIKGWFKK
jgi:hypothetical protein